MMICIHTMSVNVRCVEMFNVWTGIFAVLNLFNVAVKVRALSTISRLFLLFPKLLLIGCWAAAARPPPQAPRTM